MQHEMITFPLFFTKLELYKLSCANEPSTRAWGLITGPVQKQAGGNQIASENKFH